MSAIKFFRGLNNVTDPLRLDASWLAQADNINISDTGGVTKRDGYSRALACTPSGLYSTLDFSRMYVVDNGVLKSVTGQGATVTLQTGLSDAPMHWTEINDQVYFNNGVDRGIIGADNTVLPWSWPVPDTPVLAAVTGSLPAGQYQVRFTYTLPDGRTTGAGDANDIVLGESSALQISGVPQIEGLRTNVYIAPADSSVYQYAGSPNSAAMVWNSSVDSLGADLQTALFDPLPLGTDVVQAWRGRMYAAMYIPDKDQSVIWASQPLGFHLFDLDDDFIMVPGRVLMLAHHKDALIIGTGERIYAYAGQKLDQLAAYGVVPGFHWTDDVTRTLFWTRRGLCSVLPFTNLTENQVSVAPGAEAGGTIVQTGGQKRYLVAIKQGGSAFNAVS